MDEGPYVSYRPYSAETAGGRSAKKPKAFKPQRPTQNRAVEKAQASLASVGPEESAGNVLHAAARRQSAEFATGRAREAVQVPERFSGMSLKSFGVSAAMGGPAPRRAKEHKEGRSMDLADLAFSGDIRVVDGQVKQHYTPISLPYFSVEEGDEPAGEQVGEQAKTRPKLVHIDEANSKAGTKLLGSQQELLEDSYFLLQMPCVLPEMRNPEDEVFREQEDANSAGAGSTITRLPDGKLGKLQIYKSGKVRMEIGGVSFCVDQGCDTFFQQDLALVCPLAGEFFNLGRINTRSARNCRFRGKDLEQFPVDFG
ncbi:unnamed protein product [Effrenium voratum]|nr:unnamed protein product [Effrenium voratum]